MGFVSELRCIECGTPAPAPASAGTCSSCADPFAVLEIGFDLQKVRDSMTATALAARGPEHWRYRELLPVAPNDPATAWPVGNSPILEAPRLAAWASTGRLRVKDEGRNPTASFKDRASSVGVLHALQTGAERIACASTGNAASSLAGFAAMAGLPATIFVPERAPQPKVTQLLIYGADVRRVHGTYEQAYDLCSRECAAHGWYNRNCAINPYLVEGKKTCGLEIAEQTARDLPEWVAVSVGDGCTVAGIAKGLLEMHAIGWIDRVPKVLGVQAAGAAAIAHAFTHGALPETAGDGSVADSIDVQVPRNWKKAVRRVRETGGEFVTVTDADIEEAMRACGSLAGVFAEPAAAAAVAGVRAAGLTNADVVAVLTGNGLKDIATAMRIAGSPRDVYL